MLEQLANQIKALTHYIYELICDLGKTNNEFTRNRLRLQIDYEVKNLYFIEEAYTNLFNEERRMSYEENIRKKETQ